MAFFRHDPAYADVPSEMVGYESEEWELTGGDVQDALAWAAEHAGPDLDRAGVGASASHRQQGW